MSYVFGDFTVDPQRRVLAHRSGETVTIGDKAFDALLYLVRHSGELVSRSTLAAALWPKTTAAGNNLSQAIKALRSALGDADPPHRYVATVQRRGYQFVAAVRECDSREPSTTPQRAEPIAPAASTSEPHHEISRKSFGLRASVIPLLTLACGIATGIVVSRFLATPSASIATVPDRMVFAPVAAWPLPPLVACEQEPAESRSLRCEAFRAAASERMRRWRQGMQRT